MIQKGFLSLLIRVEVGSERSIIGKTFHKWDTVKEKLLSCRIRRSVVDQFVGMRIKVLMIFPPFSLVRQTIPSILNTYLGSLLAYSKEFGQCYQAQLF